MLMGQPNSKSPAEDEPNNVKAAHANLTLPKFAGV